MYRTSMIPRYINRSRIYDIIIAPVKIPVHFWGGMKMTCGEIFSEIYRKNKRYIFFCITICMVFSMLFYGKMYRAGTVDADTIGLVGSMGGSFGSTIAPVIATGFFGGIDTSWVMLIMSASSLGAAAGRDSGIMGFEKLSGFSFGIFENTYVCIFLLIWFGVPIILKAFSKTNALGVSIETSQKKVNGLLMLIISLSMLVTKTESKALLHSVGKRGKGPGRPA